MGAGASLVVETDDAYSSAGSGLGSDASPADAIQFCRGFVTALQQGGGRGARGISFGNEHGSDGDDEASVLSYQFVEEGGDGEGPRRHANLAELVPLGDLLTLLQHLEASASGTGEDEARAHDHVGRREVVLLHGDQPPLVRLLLEGGHPREQLHGAAELRRRASIRRRLG